MILIKGYDIRLHMGDGTVVSPPKSYGFMHDPSGNEMDRCYVFIGPYRKTKTRAKASAASMFYFGFGTQTVEAHIDVPNGSWEPLGVVDEILYSRFGHGDFVHPFDKKARPRLFGLKNWYRLSLPSDCVLDWRGFVYP